MDITLIAAAISAIQSAKDFAKAAITLRDASLIAQTESRLNEALLKAQESLFAHNAAVLGLVESEAKLRDEVSQLKKALRNKNRYTLVKSPKGQFSLAFQESDVLGEGKAAHTGQPDHHICQPCHDGMRHIVLQESVDFGSVFLCCPVCNTKVDTGERIRN